MADTPGSNRFDRPSLDLTDLDLTALARTTVASTVTVAARAAELAMDAAYVTVGLSLLGFQRAQVRRRELERALRR